MLLLPTSLRFELESAVRAAYPDEACGLLLGRPQRLAGQSSGRRSACSGGAVPGAAVVRIAPVRNLERKRPGERFQFHPEDHLREEFAARDEGLEVVGCWHSHPDRPARPSEADRAGAWEGSVWVIASVSPAGLTELRGWRLRAGRFELEPIAP